MAKRRRALSSTALATLPIMLAATAASAEAPPPDTPQVVASIKPVHSLAAAVMRGVGRPFLLIKGAGSPHSYSLRPSSARRLAGARLVFWIGGGIEAFLEKPLRALTGTARVIALSKADGIRLLKAREGGLWDAHGQHHDKKMGDGRGDDQGEYDMHVWLNPENADAMVRAIASALAKADPANAAAYRRNAAATALRLRRLDGEIRAETAGVRTRPYIVFHDAYRYFEARYQLAAAGSITVDPARSPGARRLGRIRARLFAGGVRCVFTEPQFPPRIATAIVAGTPVKLGVLDPIGADIPAGPDAYFILMRRLARSVRACLS